MLVVLKVLDDVPHIAGFDCWGTSEKRASVRRGCGTTRRHRGRLSVRHPPARDAQVKVLVAWWLSPRGFPCSRDAQDGQPATVGIPSAHSTRLNPPLCGGTLRKGGKVKRSA